MESKERIRRMKKERIADILDQEAKGRMQAVDKGYLKALTLTESNNLDEILEEMVDEGYLICYTNHYAYKPQSWNDVYHCMKHLDKELCRLERAKRMVYRNANRELKPTTQRSEE